MAGVTVSEGMQAEMVFEAQVAKIPIIQEAAEGDYANAFTRLEGFGAVWIVVGDYRQSTSLSDSLKSIFGVIQHRLLDPILLGKTSKWERILSEDWRLVLRRIGVGAEVEIKRVSTLIPMDDELMPTPIDLGQVRNAMVDLMTWTIRTIETSNRGLQASRGRDQFMSELERLKNLSVM